MKKLYIFTTALLMLAGTFTSCTKELDDVGLNASSIDAAKKEVSANNGNPNNGNPNGSQPIQTGMTVTFSETNPTVGSTVNLQVNFATLPVGGELRIEEVIGYDDNNDPIIGARLATYVPVTGPFTTEITKNEAGTYEYRAHYVPKGGSGYAQAQAFGSVTFVEAECNQGMTATVTNATRLEGNNYRITVAFTLNTCESYSDVHIQGGLTAKVSNVSTNGTIRKQTNNDNYIVFWDEASLAKGTKTYYITFDKEIKGAGDVTGDWSAKLADETVVASTEGAYFDPAK